MWHGSCNTIGAFILMLARGFMTTASIFSALRRVRFVLFLMLPLSACGQQASPWESINYNMVNGHVNADDI